jgi:hypothetical protein
MAKKHLITFEQAETYEDAEMIAPPWARAIVETNSGWMVFDNVEDAEAHEADIHGDPFEFDNY